jgi:uncharacterized membrane protein YsdA (DUF1294 family)
MHPYEDLLLIYVMSILTFALFAYDKHLAYFQKRRIPEFVLMLSATLMGAFGALCAMILFKHKTLHRKFTVGVPVLLFVQLALDILYRIFLLE